MKRANIIQDNTEFKDRILVTNLEELDQYFKQYVNPRFHSVSTMTMERKSDEISPRETNPIKRLSDHAILIQNHTGRGAIFQIAEMETKVKFAMLKYVSRGHSLMCNEAGGWNLIGKDAKIEHIGDISYLKDDIRVFKFAKGVHWYAKIKDKDVVVDGEQKWNARWIAQQKAEYFLKTL